MTTDRLKSDGSAAWKTYGGEEVKSFDVNIAPAILSHARPTLQAGGRYTLCRWRESLASGGEKK
ncbi:hypothetical protein GCM10023156_45810 [Novipirellula rosea]|uniref:Uncharacterized protein n=1 Tax=Novipirellula rosea TaxID=1031540 RepID=A0ABP8N8F3_9BACT